MGTKIGQCTTMSEPLGLLKHLKKLQKNRIIEYTLNAKEEIQSNNRLLGRTKRMRIQNTSERKP